MISYDIWCQYLINIKDRMKQRFPILTDTFDNDIRGAVPGLHIHSHGPKCQMNSSFTFTKFSGRTCGEGIESAWAEQNHAAGSTKEQSTGHRQDTLDDFNAYWNWTKLHRLRMFIFINAHDDTHIINQPNFYLPSSKSTGLNGKKPVSTSQDSHLGSQLKHDNGGKKWRRNRFWGGMGSPIAYIKWIPPTVRSLIVDILSVCLIHYKFLPSVLNTNV